MVTWFADPATCLLLIIRIASVGIFIWTLEYLYQYRSFRDGGLYGWSLLKDQPRFTVRDTWIARNLDGLLGYPNVLYVLIIRIFTALLLVFFVATPWCRLVGIIGIYITNILLIHIWTPYSRGSDDMTSVLFGALLLIQIGGESPVVVEAGLWFIALQVCLSYCGNGLAKIGKPHWMDGSAVFTTANHLIYGTPSVARFLHPRPWLTKSLTWSALVMECLFPLALIVGYPACWLFLGWGILFHTVNTYISGLNSFFWSFVAMYPAVIYVAIRVSELVSW